MTSTNQIILAFDLYGTLLSTDSIAKKLESHFPESKAQSISTLWRQYQLEYTWRLNSMGQYAPFSDMTRNALLHAVAEHSESLSEEATTSLMSAYDDLSTFPDVQPTLAKLAAMFTVTPVIFSNGTRAMISNSVQRSADLSPHAAVFTDLVTVDDVKQFKPSPATYHHLAQKMGKSREQMADLWLVSGNPFDIVGARSCGMNAIWVDRKGTGWVDAAMPHLGPTRVVKQLEEVVDIIGERV